MLSKVKSWGSRQLPRGRHLEKSSTLGLEHHLLRPGLEHTRRGGVTYNRDGKYHSFGGHTHQ